MDLGSILHCERYDVVDAEAEILIVGTSSWKSVGSVPFSAFNLDSPTYLNGVLHWLYVDKKAWIISFDLSSEQFDTHSIPPSCERNLTMGVLKGSLYVCDPSTYNNDCIDIWVLKKFGDQKSWTKLFSVEKDSHQGFGDNLYWPISYSTNGTLLIFHHPQNVQVVYYDKGLMKSKTINDCGSKFEFHTIPYAPSFISLKDIVMRGNPNSRYG